MEHFQPIQTFLRGFREVKNRFSLALVALLLVALTLPSFAIAQQTPNQGRSTGSETSRPSTTTAPPPARRSSTRSRTTTSSATAAVEQDFSEALTIIQENYVDGNKLNYNDVFKSSIIGMLRSLDPHSNYYDREEFDELKTDQRSEYFGIGASIQNQTVKDQTDTYIMATFQNSPAARAGLRYGDKILAVDGDDMRGKF